MKKEKGKEKKANRVELGFFFEGLGGCLKSILLKEVENSWQQVSVRHHGDSGAGGRRKEKKGFTKATWFSPRSAKQVSGSSLSCSVSRRIPHGVRTPSRGSTASHFDSELQRSFFEVQLVGAVSLFGF